jgi:hypothetical protein
VSEISAFWGIANSNAHPYLTVDPVKNHRPRAIVANNLVVPTQELTGGKALTARNQIETINFGQHGHVCGLSIGLLLARPNG